MTITNVNIHNIFTEGKLKAVASIVIDNFIEIHDIKVVQGTDRLFVGMPSRKTVDGGFAEKVICATSSHFCAAEKQFRFPLVYGGQRPPTAQ
ncbi:MAG: septation protein SpoVG family protein, partial [Oscillospiraceae bacterium]|nr:septation protein SpoVG family protein [Oscillospiraceae bacterium]